MELSNIPCNKCLEPSSCRLTGMCHHDLNVELMNSNKLVSEIVESHKATVKSMQEYVHTTAAKHQALFKANEASTQSMHDKMVADLATDLEFTLRQLRRIVGAQLISTYTYGHSITSQDIDIHVSKLDLERSLKSYLRGMFGVDAK